jgi:hypothetical protein
MGRLPAQLLADSYLVDCVAAAHLTLRGRQHSSFHGVLAIELVAPVGTAPPARPMVRCLGIHHLVAGGFAGRPGASGGVGSGFGEPTRGPKEAEHVIGTDGGSGGSFSGFRPPSEALDRDRQPAPAGRWRRLQTDEQRFNS